MPTFHQNEGIAPQIEVPMNITEESRMAAPPAVYIGEEPQMKDPARCRQRRERQDRHHGLADHVFGPHAGGDKTETGRLHDVDDQRHAERAPAAQCQPVSGASSGATTRS